MKLRSLPVAVAAVFVSCLPILAQVPSPTSSTPVPTTPPTEAAPVASPAAVNAPWIADAIVVGTKQKGKQQGLDLQDSGQGLMAAIAASNGDQSGTSSGFSLVAYTPVTWMRQRASEAAKEYRTFTTAEVSDDDLKAVFRVIVEADKPTYVSGAGMAGTSSVRHVVLRDNERKVAVQPLSTEPTTEEVSNSMGGRQVLQGLVAMFDLAEVAKLRGPRGDGEFFITVIGATGEEKNFKVKKKHFARIPY